MKTLIKAIGATIHAFILWVWVVLVGSLFVIVPLGAFAFIAWLFIQIFSL